MRSKLLDLDPSNANLTGFASNVTGASFTITTTATTDGLAHQVSVRNDAAVDHSAKTIVLVGTDADNKAITETINAPAASATVESTKYFKTLTSATPSATIGADTFDIGWVDEFVSQTIPLDHYAETPATAQVTVTGTIGFDLEVTLEDPFQNPGIPQDELDWLNDAAFTAKTASLGASLSVAGIRAMRVVVNSYTDTAELQVYITQPKG